MTRRERARRLIYELHESEGQAPETHPDWRDGPHRAIYQREHRAYKELLYSSKLDAVLLKMDRREVKAEQPKPQSQTRKDDVAFYRAFWEHMVANGERANGNLLMCEECKAIGRTNWLPYSASHCSHDLTRGAHRQKELAHNYNNMTVLCLEHHNQWERDGQDRKVMAIYPKKAERMRANLQALIKDMEHA